MMKTAVLSGVLFSSILLFGCNAEPAVVILEDVGNEVNEAEESLELNMMSEIQEKLMVAIEEGTQLDNDSIESFMVSGNAEELTVSISLSEDAKVDETMIQQIIEDAIKEVSETEHVPIGEENMTIKIEGI